MLNKVKFYREQKNMTQEQLVLKSGVSRPIISDLETGKKNDIKAKTMIAIADALGEKIQDVFFCDES